MKKLLLTPIFLLSATPALADCTETIEVLLSIAAMKAETITQLENSNEYVVEGTAYTPGSSVIAFDKGPGTPFALRLEVDPAQCSILAFEEL